MRILVVGAGAVGGYFGGRLLESGEDVTFLVRERRRKQLEDKGLVIESIHGNAFFHPKTILTGENAERFDIILLSTKAYHLDKAIEDIIPFVGKETVILPLLNGISHIEKLANRFGEEKVIGGLCFIETTLDHEGKIIQTSPIHDLVFGERSGEKTDRIHRIEKTFSKAKATFRLSDHINRDMWQKYLFISTMSGITTLYRSAIGPILKEESGRNTIKQLLNEIISVMNKLEAPIVENIESIILKQLDGLTFTMKSSMQRDMEKLLPVEADHLHGHLLKFARQHQINTPVLEAIYANLKIYEGYSI